MPPRLLTTLLLAVAALALGWVAAASALWFQTADFFCLWMGGRLVLNGIDPYDHVQWTAATAGLYPDPRGLLLPSSCPGAFGYPLWTALALVPFGALPVEIAATLWAAISIVGTATGALLAWITWGGGRKLFAVFVVLVLFAQPFWTLFVSGQMVGVMLGFAAACEWALAGGRSTIAAISVVGLLLKPQLALLVLPSVVAEAIARRRLRLLVWIGATTAAIIVASVVVEPSWPSEWLDEVFSRRLAGTVAIRPTIWNVAALLLGDPKWGVVLLVAIIALLTLVAGRELFEPRVLVPVSATLSLLATPYISSYDHLVLVLPWAGTLAIASETRGPVRMLLLVATVVVASVLPWLLFAMAQTGGNAVASALVPFLAAVLLAIAVRVRPRSS